MKTTKYLPLALLALFAVGRLMAQAPVPAPGAAPGAQPPPLPTPTPPPAATVVEPPQQGIATRGDATVGGQDTLTVDFPDTEVRIIISSVADLFDLNVVIPDTLQGRTSIKLRNVTWRQIFQTVLDPVGFTYVVDGNIIKIVSRDSLQAEPVEIFPVALNYAKATDILPTITQMINTAAGGKIAVDTRTNSLIITERPTAMNKIMPIILQLDTATAQVAIETKFIEVTDGDIKNLGVNWSVLKAYNIGATPQGSFDRQRGQTLDSGTGGTRTEDSGNTTSSTGSQSITSTTGAGATATLSNTIDSTITSGISQTLNFLNSITNTGGTNREVTAVFNASQFGFVLSALNELSRTKVISSPTIVTLNNTEATINVGDEDPIPNYQYNDQRGSFEVAGFQFKSIGVNLKVTPQVNASGFIRLVVSPEVSQRNGTRNFGGAAGAEIPIIATRKISTQVSLKDGQTVGIGGLLRTQSINSGAGVPLLSKIPFLGGAFRNKSREETTTNLLIFITAKSVAADGPPIEHVFSPASVRAAGILRSDLPGYRDGSDPFMQPPPVAQPPQSIK